MTDYIAKAEFKLTAKVEREKLKEIIILLDLQKEELSKQKVIIDYRSRLQQGVSNINCLEINIWIHYFWMI